MRHSSWNLVVIALLSTVLLAATTACGGADEVAATPSPTPDPRPRIEAMVNAAALKPADLGVKKATREETITKPTVPCAASPTSEPVAAHYWSYTGGSKVDILSHGVYGYSPETGATTIRQVVAALKTCTTWTWAGTITMKVVGQFTVTRPAGMDGSVSFCHQGTIASGAGKGDKVYICDGLVSRGQLVARVDTLKLTLADAQKELKKAVPLAAAALVRAVPAP